MTLTSSFHYDLPADRIAQEPCQPRDAARLLVDQGPGSAPAHRTVADLADLMRPADVVVINETRVRRARLELRKPTGGAVEVLLLAPLQDGRAAGAGGDRPATWEALVRPSRRVPPGTVLHGKDLQLVVGARLGDGRRAVQVSSGPSAVETHGQVPLPPYIHRPLADPERYQTVFARAEARSAAAPTAGLHLTAELLDRCRRAGARIEAVELEIGLGTFRPITTNNVEDHRMHSERYRVPAPVLDACLAAERVVGIGTTVVRALESAARTGELEAETDLYIRNPFPFQVVDVLVTNFHVPGSSLLVMVDAFVGPRWREIYEIGLTEGYRFLSFGDAMWLTRTGAQP